MLDATSNAPSFHRDHRIYSKLLHNLIPKRTKDDGKYERRQAGRHLVFRAAEPSQGSFKQDAIYDVWEFGKVDSYCVLEDIRSTLR